LCYAMLGGEHLLGQIECRLARCDGELRFLELMHGIGDVLCDLLAGLLG
jgi:hypothetical protein